MKLINSILLSTGILIGQIAIADINLADNQKVNIFENKISNYSLWRTIGYGYVLEVNGESVRFYDITENHCIINHEETGEYPSSNIKITDDKAVLEWDTLHPVKLTKLDKLPKLCDQDLMLSVYDNHYKFSAPQVFDVFWNTYGEHFAFSEEIKWDWEANYLVWWNKINEQSTEKELAVVLRTLMVELGDGHGYVLSQTGDYIAGHNIKASKFNKNRLEKAFLEQNKFTSPHEFLADFDKQNKEIIASYFDENFTPQRLNRAFLFTQLSNGVSYLSIDDMSEYTEQETIKDDLEIVDKVMKQILPIIRQSKGLVIDLRWNTGGQDLVSKKLLSYLINKPLNIGSKQVRLIDGFSEPNHIVINPEKLNNYLGEITVLTSPRTMSAAEILTLGLAARGKVTFIGEASNGSYSDSLAKQLPNGWELVLSNERYIDFQGNNHEFSGFPVTKKFEYLKLSDIQSGKDPAIEAAINILK